MGLYVNPSDRPKEVWLVQNGRQIGPTPPAWGTYGEDSSAVCLVNNGMFTAAAVAYSLREMEEFARADGRPKTWFVVPDSKLNEVVTGGKLSEWKARG